MFFEFVRKALRIGTTATVLGFAAIASPPAASAQPALVTAHEWASYTARYLDRSGRIVDVVKNGVSHSEGQGYGLLLAVYANDEATFRRILRFTFNEMRGRGDGLISWLYNPRAYPPVTDTNNASDGAILIAYALVQAAMQWNDARYLADAEPLIDAIGRHLLVRHGDKVLLKPAAFGFDRHTHRDGPVVNLSYFVYGAFPLFAQINTRYPWIEAWQSGLMLTAQSLSGREALAPDWVSLRGDRYLKPASGYAKKSSYDAVRIPLYLVFSGVVPRPQLLPFDRAWNGPGAQGPAVILRIAVLRHVSPFSAAAARLPA